MVQRPDIDGNCFKTVTIDSLTYIYGSGTNKLVQVIDNAPCLDTITLPAVIDRDVNYAAGQLIRIATTDVLCNVNMNLTAGTEIKILDTLHLPNSCGTPALVIAYQGPCPQDKYTEGFNQQSTTGQYGHDLGGNMFYDPNKQLAFYYNHLNLQYLIVGPDDELEMLYSADGTLLQRKYTKSNVEVSKRDYLRGKELKNGLMEAVYFADGRILKDGATWQYEYHIKDHLGNVRVTFADDNNNGLILGSEIRSRNDYYAFGMEWDNYWQIGEFSDPENRYKYNGKELVEEMGLNQLLYGARNMMPDIGRFTTVDPLSEIAPGWTPYRYGFNNPIIYNDPNGMFESQADAKSYAKDNGIKTSWFSRFFGSGSKIVENKDKDNKSFWSIDNKKEGSTYYQDKSMADGAHPDGVFMGALVAADDVMDVSMQASGNLISVQLNSVQTLRDGSTRQNEMFNTLSLGTVGSSVGATTTSNLPMQIHHFATNKHSFFTKQMKSIADGFGLKLNGAWNKQALPHLGRHPTDYHNFVLQGMQNAKTGAGGSQKEFLKLFNQYVKQPVIQNPELLRKSGW